MRGMAHASDYDPIREKTTWIEPIGFALTSFILFSLGLLVETASELLCVISIIIP